MAKRKPKFKYIKPVYELTTNDPLLKTVNGEETRIMDAAEVKERDALYVANTASSLIRRAKADKAKMNGRGGKP